MVKIKSFDLKLFQLPMTCSITTQKRATVCKHLKSKGSACDLKLSNQTHFLFWAVFNSFWRFVCGRVFVYENEAILACWLRTRIFGSEFLNHQPMPRSLIANSHTFNAICCGALIEVSGDAKDWNSVA